MEKWQNYKIFKDSYGLLLAAELMTFQGCPMGH
jgi:hypothetical protein